jgi:hypothetical protein
VISPASDLTRLPAGRHTQPRTKDKEKSMKKLSIPHPGRKTDRLRRLQPAKSLLERAASRARAKRDVAIRPEVEKHGARVRHGLHRVTEGARGRLAGRRR